ncbi:MAG: hypothetical protein KBG28_22990 [Kofleriaceae bacterium]|nr:hypothetical protein [Kofleriaceae bacterium]MBP6837493.1 hypothetical protein [Kofleriaceae bacterium]MBP9206857.1 hypothetical protein [Kofleriaceae bacterium]
MPLALGPPGGWITPHGRDARPGRFTHRTSVLLVAGALAATRAGPAWADQATLRPSGHPDADLLWLGATGAVWHDAAGADSAFGGHLAWTRLRQHGRVPVVGLGAAVVRPARASTARLTLEGLAGRRLRPWLALGLSLGPALELRQNAPARAGVTGSLWLFAGVSPFVRATTTTDGATVLEAGLEIAVPVARF